jgi:hypothetical protein
VGTGRVLPASSPVSATAVAECGRVFSGPPGRPLMLGDVVSSGNRAA